jgi:hypothetical protein
VADNNVATGTKQQTKQQTKKAAIDNSVKIDKNHEIALIMFCLLSPD